MKKPVISFIGAGNMAGYLIKGLILHGFEAQQIIATCKTSDSLNAIASLYDVQVMTDNSTAVTKADIVVFCVKPHNMQEVIESVAYSLQKNKPLIISIAAGITLHSLQTWSGGNLPIVRAMPNLPVAVKQGVCSLYADPVVSDEQKKLVDEVLSPVSELFWVDKESLIDVCTALAGSGPAYFYRFTEALSEGSQTLGLDKKTADKMAFYTGLGALMLLQQSGDSLAVMRKRVTSPNGTTAAALNAFNEQGLHEIVETALIAAVNRAKELSKG